MKYKPGYKLNVYLTWAELADMQAEARRLNRSLSNVVQLAWRVARDEVKRFGKRPWPPLKNVCAVCAGTAIVSAFQDGRLNVHPCPHCRELDKR
jgi:uncharacterized small protein (TIGR04563 family)